MSHELPAQVCPNGWGGAGCFSLVSKALSREASIFCCQCGTLPLKKETQVEDCLMITPFLSWPAHCSLQLPSIQVCFPKPGWPKLPDLQDAGQRVFVIRGLGRFAAFSFAVWGYCPTGSCVEVSPATAGWEVTRGSMESPWTRASTACPIRG